VRIGVRRSCQRLQDIQDITSTNADLGYSISDSGCHNLFIGLVDRKSVDHRIFSRHTLKDTLSRSLYFLDGRLANIILDSVKKTKLMETYMSDPNLPDVEIEIKNVVLEEIQNHEQTLRL